MSVVLELANTEIKAEFRLSKFSLSTVAYMSRRRIISSLGLPEVFSSSMVVSRTAALLADLMSYHVDPL